MTSPDIPPSSPEPSKFTPKQALVIASVATIVTGILLMRRSDHSTENTHDRDAEELYAR